MPTKYVTVAGVATQFSYSGRTTLPPEPPLYGSGPSLLFLHGVGGNAGLWRPQVERSAAEYTSLALDYPGHGRSGGTEALGSIEAYADFTAAFAAAVKLPSAVLIGTCMGGSIALELAAQQPPWLRALVLVNTAARLHFAAEAVELWRAVTCGRASQPFTMEGFSPKTDFAVMRELWMEQVKTDPRVRYHDLLAANAYDGRASLGLIRVPTLVIAGRDDSLVALDAAEDLQRGIAGSRLIVLDDAGHHCAYERADAFAAAIGAFVSSLPQGAA